MIPAYSPQARGRSERSFGTWQGRLPQELRLRGIQTPGKDFASKLESRRNSNGIQPSARSALPARRNACLQWPR